MAGMPESVVARANDVLSELEARTPIATQAPEVTQKQQKTHRVADGDNNKTQLNLFG